MFKKTTRAAVALAVVTAISFSAAVGVSADEQASPVLSRVVIVDADGSEVTEVDVVTGASVVLNVLPSDIGSGAIYGEYEQRVDDRGSYLWFGEEVTFVLGRHVDGELYIADRFFNGEWGGVRVGWGRRNFLFIDTTEENNRTNTDLIVPGSYDFWIFAISGNADMPNPPVDADVFSMLEGAPAMSFRVNVLAADESADAEPADVDPVDEEPADAETSATPAAPAQDVVSADAVPSAHSVLVDGEGVAFRAFNIGGNNFFMLRDIAYALNGSDAQFEVNWDDEALVITLTTGEAYTPVGGEMATAQDAPATALLTTAAVYVDGAQAQLLAYNIGGNNFFMLRDLGAALGFDVDFDYEEEVVLISTN
ncbi:MAG: DUF3275 family protein [Defluviitaleaceae bacterium]|nr:DUF3275 family protein [Defluviitaleaceae bacterium]